jgi:3-oxoacyl-[acyl-carrier protein] reductase
MASPSYLGVSGLVGNPGQSNYSASKAGVIGMSQSVAKGWRPPK